MLLAIRKCVQKHSTHLKWDLVIQEIQPLVCRKKIDINLQAQLCWGIMHFIIQSALLDYSFPFLILVFHIRLVYHTLNFQIIAIALTSLIKDILSSVALVKQQACVVR